MQSITIAVKVNPFSKENNIKEEVDLFGNTVYKIKTTATPQDGEANEAVIKIIAKHFKVAKSNVNIIKGFTNREKIISITI